MEKTRVCNRGSARYLLEKAYQSDFKITEGFAEAVRALPASYGSTTRNEYGRFLDTWGTHVVSGVTVGSKYI